MSAENVELIKRAHAAFTEHGFEVLADYISDDYYAVAPPELSAEPDTYIGIAGIRRWFVGFEGYMEDVRFEADEFVDAGDAVLVNVRLIGRGVTSGLDAEQQMWQVWGVRDGKITSLQNATTLEAARTLAAAEG